MNSKRHIKKERFIALAEARMKKIVFAMRSLGKLSNRQNYEYSQDEATEMLKFLKNEINVLENLFLKEKKVDNFKFKK